MVQRRKYSLFLKHYKHQEERRSQECEQEESKQQEDLKQREERKQRIQRFFLELIGFSLSADMRQPANVIPACHPKLYKTSKCWKNYLFSPTNYTSRCGVTTSTPSPKQGGIASTNTLSSPQRPSTSAAHTP
jgi:hypothetical protein